MSNETKSSMGETLLVSDTAIEFVPEPLRPLLQFIGKPPSPTLVGEILSAPERLTVPIAAALLRKALPVDSAGMLDRRAQKLLRGIARSKAGTVPANALDLAAWSELNDAEAAGAEIVVGEVAKLRQRERTPRKFVRCLGCDKRFLARRKNHVTCSSRCQRRANRKTAKVALSDFVGSTPLEAAPGLAI
jgi:hypothetical protein